MRVIVRLASDNALSFMRRVGYGYQKEGSGEVAFTRRVGASPFPRYHAYVTEADSRQPTAASTKEIVINLHLDQKETTYQGSRAHSGEYDGPLIVEECARLRALAVAPKPVAPPKPPEPKRGFFGTLFG